MIVVVVGDTRRRTMNVKMRVLVNDSKGFFRKEFCCLLYTSDAADE